MLSMIRLRFLKRCNDRIPKKAVPIIPMSAQFCGGEFIALGVFRIVVSNVSVAVKANWNAVLQGVWPILLFRNDVMAFHLHPAKLVTNATPATTRDQCIGFYLWRKGHGTPPLTRL